MCIDLERERRMKTRQQFKNTCALVLCVLLIMQQRTLAQPATRNDLLDKVNVFTGTSNSRWMLFPGASTPMGMVKMSPDNQGNVWNGGYEYTVGSIAGFGFLHTFGLDSFDIMPLHGNIENYPGQPRLFAGSSDGPFGGMWTAGYRSRMDKKTETGRPGYYAVDLIDAQTRAELTATDRTGWLRFTPAAQGETHLLLDFANSGEERRTISSITVQRAGLSELTGSITQRNKYAGEFTVYFDMLLSKPMTAMNAWENGDYTGADTNYGTEYRRPRTMQRNAGSFTTAKTGGVWLDFDPAQRGPVVVKTGISLVGVEQAKANLRQETNALGFDFDSVVRETGAKWATLLSRVEVKGGSADDAVKLYTNLYRSYTAKAMVDDVDGSYRNACGELRRVPQPGQHLYSSDGLWGAQWDLGPMWSLLAPDVLESFDRALLVEAKDGGWLPDAPTAVRYSPVMDAHHEMALLTGAWQKHLRGFDGEGAYQAMRKVLTSPGVPYTCGGSFPQGIAGDRHMAAYMKLGYVPEEDGPASSTMEYAFDDACAAVLAKSLGHADDAAMFAKRAENWRNILSPTTHYAQRRHADGTWIEPNDLYHFGTTGGWAGPGFLEGTAWIYSWFVPGNVPGLVALLGTDQFNARLEAGFKENHVDLTNEPNLQAPWLFNDSGKPWLTQKYARDVYERVFDTSPLNGWPGEEDEGQMGSYLVLAGIGLFDMEGGCAAQPRYQISGPAFDQVTLHLRGGEFHIVAHNNSPTHVYIQSAALNGKPLSLPQIPYSALEHGGELVLDMGPSPSRTAFHAQVQSE